MAKQGIPHNTFMRLETLFNGNCSYSEKEQDFSSLFFTTGLSCKHFVAFLPLLTNPNPKICENHSLPCTIRKISCWSIFKTWSLGQLWNQIAAFVLIPPLTKNEPIFFPYLCPALPLRSQRLKGGGGESRAGRSLKEEDCPPPVTKRRRTADWAEA